jgi:stage V sporulation protein SpoVS
MEIIQVSATSPASAIAQAISSVVHEYLCAEVEAIGADAYRRARQALTLATRYLRHDGIGVSCVPKRRRVVVGNKHMTLTKVMVKVTTTSSPCPHFFPDASLNRLIKPEDLPRA